MMSTNFKLWLIGEEINRLYEAYVLMEDPLHVVIASNNPLFARMIPGIQHDWFGTILQKARKYAQGQDSLIIASETSSDILRELHDKTSQLAQNFARITALPPEGDERGPRDQQILKYFFSVVEQRMRPVAKTFKTAHDRRSSQFSTISGNKGGFEASIADPHGRDSELSDEQRMDSFRKGIMMELERMKQSANDVRSKERLELAKTVADARMSRAPDFPGIEELMSMFPDVKHTKMYQIMQDIQAASMVVAQERGIGLPGKARRQQAGGEVA